MTTESLKIESQVLNENPYMYCVTQTSVLRIQIQEQDEERLMISGDIIDNADTNPTLLNGSVTM